MDVATLWAVGTFFVSAIMTGIGWALKGWRDNANRSRDETKVAIDSLKTAHNALELKVANDYISVATFRHFEDRVVKTIDALGEKFEAMFRQTSGERQVHRRRAEDISHT